MKKYVER